MQNKIIFEIKNNLRFLLSIVLVVLYPLFIALIQIDFRGLEHALVLAFFLSVLTCLWLVFSEVGILRVLVSIGLALLVVFNYDATGALISNLKLEHLDLILADVDRTLWGWLFAKGQISFWLDGNSWLNPSTMPGKILTEIFQIAYSSYYFWSLGLVFALCAKTLFGAKKQESWSALKLVMSSYSVAYIFNYIGYILVPAVGPRLVFENYYKHALQGLWLTIPFREIIMNNQSTLEDCFPSGHTAISWLTAIMFLRFFPKVGRIAVVAAILITMATLYLRYHYIVDLIAALPLIVLALLWGFVKVPQMDE